MFGDTTKSPVWLKSELANGNNMPIFFPCEWKNKNSYQPKRQNGWIQRGRDGHEVHWDRVRHFHSFFLKNEAGCTHLPHRALLSKLCQQTQYWWDVAPHQHWRGLGTLYNTLWTRKTEGHCCERNTSTGKRRKALVIYHTSSFSRLMWTRKTTRPRIRGVA